MFSKNFIFLSLIFMQSFSAFAQVRAKANFEIIDRPAGPDKSYYLFMNLNTSLIEESHFRAMAKSHGYGFVMVPNQATVDSMAPDVNLFVSKKCDSNHLSPSCAPIDQRLNDKANDHPIDLAQDLQTALKALSGSHIRAMAFSGHNSEGGFSGDYLSPDTFLHTDVAELLVHQSEVDPELFSKISFLALWGCDSVNDGEASIFEKALPTLTVIAGYGDTAPSGIRPISGIYLESALKAANDLVQAKSKSELGARINQMNGLKGVYAGLWIKTLNIGKWLYRRSTQGTSLVKVDANCDAFLSKRFYKDEQTVRAYFDAKIEIPQDYPGSPLKVAYYDFMSYGTCYAHGKAHDPDPNAFLSPTQIGMLRFFSGYKANFVLVFDKLMSNSMKEEILMADRRELLSLTQQLLLQDFQSQKLGMLIDRYLNQLDGTCIDFLEWHETKTGDLPTPLCTLDERKQWIIKQP